MAALLRQGRGVVRRFANVAGRMTRQGVEAPPTMVNVVINRVRGVTRRCVKMLPTMLNELTKGIWPVALLRGAITDVKRRHPKEYGV